MYFNFCRFLQTISSRDENNVIVGGQPRSQMDGKKRAPGNEVDWKPSESRNFSYAGHLSRV